MPLIRALLGALALAVATGGHANEIDKLLASDEAPPGVVFEIIGSPNYLSRALHGVKNDIERLRARFPDMEFAVVSHGTEQFALLTEAQDQQKKVHSLTQTLTSSDVPVHVCATHAGWRGFTEDDFPSYVSVSASGPAQINDYVALDYHLIVVSD